MRYLVRAELALCEVADRSREERRAGLAGVWVTPSGAWASDGFLLLHVRRPRREDLGADRAFIPREVAVELLRQLPSGAYFRRPHVMAAECQVTAGVVQVGRISLPPSHEYPVEDGPPPLSEARALREVAEGRPTWGVALPLDELRRLIQYVERAGLTGPTTSLVLWGGFTDRPTGAVAVQVTGHRYTDDVIVEGAMAATNLRPEHYRPVKPVEDPAVGSYQ